MDLFNKDVSGKLTPRAEPENAPNHDNKINKSRYYIVQLENMLLKVPKEYSEGSLLPYLRTLEKNV